MSLPRTQFRTIALLAAALLAALPAPARAAEDCAELLLSMRERARAGFPAPFKVSFRIWSPPTMSVSQAVRELDAISDYPDHPNRLILERALLEAQAGGWSDPESVWYFGDDRLRYSTVDTLARNDDETRIDIGVDGDAYWTLGNNSLTLVRGRTAPENMNQHRYIHRILQSVVGLAVAPGLYAHLADVRLESCQADGAAWSAVWTRKRGQTRLSVSGTIASDGELLTTGMRAVMVDGEPRRSGTGVEFSDHRYDEVFARSVPRRISFIGEDARPVRKYEILKIAPLAPSDADAYVRRPNPGDRDPVRGEVAYTTVTDWRSGSPSVEIGSSTGWTTPLNAPQTQSSDSAVGVRGFVLIGVGLLGLGAGALWWFRSGR